MGVAYWEKKAVVGSGSDVVSLGGRDLECIEAVGIVGDGIGRMKGGTGKSSFDAGEAEMTSGPGTMMVASVDGEVEEPRESRCSDEEDEVEDCCQAD